MVISSNKRKSSLKGKILHKKGKIKNHSGRIKTYSKCISPMPNYLKKNIIGTEHAETTPQDFNNMVIQFKKWLDIEFEQERIKGYVLRTHPPYDTSGKKALIFEY